MKFKYDWYKQIAMIKPSILTKANEQLQRDIVR